MDYRSPTPNFEVQKGGLFKVKLKGSVGWFSRFVSLFGPQKCLGLKDWILAGWC